MYDDPKVRLQELDLDYSVPSSIIWNIFAFLLILTFLSVFRKIRRDKE